jgi:hypothetical protein
MRRTARMVSAALLLVAVGGVGTADARGLLGKRRPAPAHNPAGLFASPCVFSHRRADDPIVAPGSAGGSHMHDFFGNESTNASSTRASLLSAGDTSCRRGDDLAGYWIPTLYLGSRAIKPSFTAYYLVAGRNPAFIRSFPTGLKIVAGNSRTTEPQETSVVNWTCAGEGRKKQRRPRPPLCLKRDLVLTINFPDCWDGVNVDSVDHKSHMAYSVRQRSGGRACPASHSTPVPGLRFRVRYRTRGGPLTRLASGPTTSAHGDFFNTWRQSTLDALVQRCLNANVNCHAN